MHLIKGRHYARLASQPARDRTRSSPRCEYLEPRCLLSIAAPDNLSNITATPSVFYTPGQIKTAYRVSSIPTQYQGAGETIAIVDAFNQPNIASDLATADVYAGIPDPPSFTIVNQTGATSPLPRANLNWGAEISLDVEWAHFIAPAANILLVEANTGSLANLLKAVDTARNYPGVAVVSMSWGNYEFSSESNYDSFFTTPAGHTGVTFVAASGDKGGTVIWPATSPNVLSVGGTTLMLNAENTWRSETSWSGSGGGVSLYEPSPSYQSGMGYSQRTTPDVSYDANLLTGFYIYDTYGLGGLTAVGGTSAGSPQWAALIAITDEIAGQNLDGASQTLPAIYNTAQNAYSSNFHDITSGSAGGNNAGTGYDLVTGWGSPIANSIVSALASEAPTSDLVTSPQTSTPLPTHGHPQDVSVIAVAPVASSLAQQTVTSGIGAVNGPIVNPVAVPVHSSPVPTSVSSSAASPTATAGLSSTTGRIGLGQDLLRAALTKISVSPIARPADGNPEAAEVGRQTSESESTHVPAVPGAPIPLVPAVPGGDEGPNWVPENLKPAGKEKGDDAPTLPQSMIPPSSELDPLGEESPSDTRSNGDAAWGVCLMVGATAAVWNSRSIAWRRGASRRFRRISTRV